MTSSLDNARQERLFSLRDRLAALLCRYRARHPAAALERIELFVRTIQGLAPPVEAPPGQRPDLLRFRGLPARPWYERPDCTIRVGYETRTWTEGGCLVFDDSFEHEVWHRGEGDRIVLLVRLPHPDLTGVEIDALADIEEDVGGLLGDTAAARKASLEDLRLLPR